MASMTSRDILARNIRSQIEHDTPHGGRVSVRGWALGKGLDVKLVERILKNHNAVTLDKLQEIATACGVEPWHLLLEDYTPGKAPPPPLTDDDRATLAKLRRLFDSA